MPNPAFEPTATRRLNFALCVHITPAEHSPRWILANEQSRY